MSLNIDNTLVKDYDKVIPACGGSYQVAVMAMVIGVRDFTESNIEDVWHRVSFMEKATGSFRNVSDGETMKPLPYTKEEILSLVGVRTNVTPITKAKFINHVWDLHKRYG